MNINDIKVNQDNHAKFDVVHSFSIQGRKALEAHMSLNEYLDSVLPDHGVDYGGKYAAYLDKIGIASNSENGWWSINAVNPDNIQFFVESWGDEEKEAAYRTAKKNYEKLSGKIRHTCKTITEFIELFKEL